MRSEENVAFITGSGAIENAWSPIIKILEDIPLNICDADSVNCYLTRIIYLLRFYSVAKLPNSKIELKEILQDFKKLKEAICAALIFAEKIGMIKPRQEIENILKKFIFSKTIKSVFITTNWDLVLDNYINKIGQSKSPSQNSSSIIVHHIHGSVESSNSLYLPSEIINEPYRSEEDNQEMGYKHAATIRILQQCDKTIIYGLSLDPLDAELSQILASGWGTGKTREIIVINPDYKKVCQRVRLLITPEHNININGIYPSNLNKKFKYL